MLIYLLNLSKNLPRSTGRNFPCNEILLRYRLVQYFFSRFSKKFMIRHPKNPVLSPADFFAGDRYKIAEEKFSS